MKKLLLLLVIMTGSMVGSAQALQEDLCIKYLVQPPHEKGTKSPLVILLHGYGSNEQDLFSLKDAFPKNCIVVSARAPYPLQQGGYQWYELTMKDGKREGNVAQMEQSVKLVGQFVNELVKKYGADADNVIVMGFSQGAIMSYMTGLTKTAKIKGIGVLSGKIHAATKPDMKKTQAYDLKIFAAHGTNDQVIPYEEGKEAADIAASLGYKPEFHTYKGMGHSICNEEAQELAGWLKKNTAPAAKQGGHMK
jgi:phospholipase/carboxylesterase